MSEPTTETGAEYRCLAIETSSPQGSVAVSNGEHVFSVNLGDESGSSRQVYGAVREALGRADMGLDALTCVAFGCGPGSFTGVRVASAAAQALAFALELPVVPVSSLAAVAVEAGRTRGAEPVAVCMDARMQQAYLGIYEFNSSGVATALLADGLVDPADYRLPDDSRPVLAAGPGWDAYPELLANNADRISARATEITPGAAAVLVEAEAFFRQSEVLAPHEALPNYVRDQVTHQGRV